MYTFRYTLSEEDYLNFNINFLHNMPQGKKSLLIYRLVIPFFSLLVMIIFLCAEAEVYLLVTESIVLFLMSIMWVIFTEKILTSSLKKAIRTNNKKKNLSPSGSLIFDSEKITDVNDRVELKIPYSTIKKLVIAETAFYFYFDDAHAIILPYHNFTSTDTFNDFSKWIRNVIDTEKIV